MPSISMNLKGDENRVMGARWLVQQAGRSKCHQIFRNSQPPSSRPWPLSEITGWIRQTVSLSLEVRALRPSLPLGSLATLKNLKSAPSPLTPSRLDRQSEQARTSARQKSFLRSPFLTNKTRALIGCRLWFRQVVSTDRPTPCRPEEVC